MLLYKPQPWRSADSISVATTMVDMLDTHWNVKVERERIRATLNNPQLEAELYPVGSWRDHPPTGDAIDWSKPDPARTQTDEDNETARAAPQALKPRSLLLAFTTAKAVPLQSQPVLAGVSALEAELGLPDCGGCVPGSNNWVISGKHTASGLPLLANDMHLPIQVPNIWFMAELEAPGFHVEGVTLPVYRG